MRPLEDVDAVDATPPPRQGWDGWREVVLRPSLRNFLVSVVSGLILAAAGAWAILARTPQYYSQATLLIDNPAAIATAHDDAPIVKLNVLRSKYASLAATPAIQAPAAQASGLPLADIAKSITFPSTASLILVVGARTERPALSQQVANAVADEIPRYVRHEHDQYDVPGPDRFVFTVVGPAYPGQKVAPTRSKAATTAVAAGLAGLAVAYVALQLVTGSRRRR